MPTILRVGPYRLFFYSNEGLEPRHVHVERDDGHAKFWLDPVALARSRGLSSRELRRIEEVVKRHRTTIIEAWHEHFGS